MTHKEASSFLNLGVLKIPILIKNNILKIDKNKKIIPESVFLYAEELALRRSLEKPKWIHLGGRHY